MDGPVTENGRPTTASIDRRVERLEHAQAETDRKIDQVSMQVGFVKEMMDLKFTSIEAFMKRIEEMIADATKNAGDIRANPLGRQVDDRLAKLERRADELISSERIVKLEDKVEILDDNAVRAAGLGGVVRAYVIPALALILSGIAILVGLSSGGT